MPMMWEPKSAITPGPPDGSMRHVQGRGWIMHIVFGMNATKPCDFTQFSRLNHLPRQFEQWVLDVVEADLRVHALGLGCLYHLQ